MRAALTLIVGAVFSGLLLVLPASHGARWHGVHIDGLDWALIALPFLALVGATVRPSRWLNLWGWPAAHLPALIAEPGLSAGAVFGEGGTFWAALTLGVTATAWFLLHLWPTAPVAGAAPPTDAGGPPRAGVLAHPLSALALALTLGIYVAFLSSAVGSPDVEPLAASITLLVGAVITWVVVARFIATDLGDVVLSASRRRQARARLLLGRRPSLRTTWLSVGVAALALIVVVMWYLVMR